jgi:dolichyl-phosphate beta-glucosyltransferase
MAFDRMALLLVGSSDRPEMSSRGEPFVSIIIPAYNEAHRLEASTRALREYLGLVPWSYEVILVVELSTDGTLDLAQRLVGQDPSFEVVGNEVHRGKGCAVRTGMLRARGEIVFFMDVDLSTPLPEVDHFLARFARNPPVDVLIGNRQHAQSEILKSQHFVRKKMGQTFNAILRAVSRIRIADTQCGFKAFRREAARRIFELQKLDGFAFDVEVLILAERLGFKVEDMPVQWINAEGSKVRIIRDSYRMLRDALLVRRLVGRTLAGRSRAG